MERDYKLIKENFYNKYEIEDVKGQLIKFIDQELDLESLDDKGKKYDKIINHFFQKNIYMSKSSRGVENTLSPDECLDNYEMLDKIFAYIDSKPNFYTGDDIANLKSFFRNAGKWVGKVANFSPNVARKIYEKYCPKENANILDYSCGFGSRMLGCLTSKYNFTYYGIDPNSRLQENLEKLGTFISENKNVNYKLYCQGSEEYIEELENKIDLAFSSPPYFKWEIYTEEETQSVSKFPEYDGWLKNYTVPTIQNIYKYLKDDGLFIINIKNLTRSKNNPKLMDDWLRLAQQNGFELIEIVDMKHQAAKSAIQKYQNEVLKNKYDYQGFKEPLLILKKRRN